MDTFTTAWLMSNMILILLTLEFYIIKRMRITDRIEDVAAREAALRKATNRMIVVILVLAVVSLLICAFHGTIDALIDEWSRPAYSGPNNWEIY